MAELASSRNLKNWSRLGDRQAFIEPSRTDCGAYDLTQIMSPASAVVRDDELWFYYSGLKYRALTSEKNRRDLDKDSSAICLAVLRRDGFVSLDVGENGGTVLTDPFVLFGKRLFVNVDAAGGELSVEALDGDGGVVAVSAPLEGDHPSAELVWQQGNMGEQLNNVVSLRFTLRNAKLYSYWVEA